MSRLVAIALVTLFALGAILWALLRPPAAPPVERLDVARALGGVSAQGFARATAARTFHFPDDHGPHPRYRNEWWYFTGNLVTGAGRRFGYELSIFRIALSPTATPRASAWGTNQVYMAHFAVTDVASGKFHFFERFARGAVGLAGARAAPFGVWTENWRVAADPHDPGVWTLHAKTEDVEIALSLSARKPVVLQGERGLSRKSADPGNASYYYSLPRLASEGTINIAGATHHVTGNSWLDREWSTSALASNQVGWDWFALQFDDGRELMLYQLRDRNGHTDAFSQGALIAPDGRKLELARNDFRVEVLRHWRSPRGGDYPAAWRISVPRAQLDLQITPVLADQELAVSVRYWEGAVDVRGTHAGRKVKGTGYVELTGYADGGARVDPGLRNP